MRRGLVKAAAVLGLTLALSVLLAASAPAARAEWAPRRVYRDGGVIWITLIFVG